MLTLELSNLDLPMPSMPPQSAGTVMLFDVLLREPMRAVAVPRRAWAHRYCRMSWRADTMVRWLDRAWVRSLSVKSLCLYSARTSV